METLTLSQAYEAIMRWLKPHPWSWTVGMLIDAADHEGVFDRSGEPVSGDPAEWPDFKRAALAVLLETQDAE